MSAKVFVDTNVLVYSRDTAQLDKHTRASEWMRQLWGSGTGRLSMQVLSEFYALVTGKLKPGMEASLAREDVKDLQSWNPLPLTADLFLEAWDIQDRFQLAWWDALIIAAAIELKCNYILSEDFQHHQHFYGIRVINPFQLDPKGLQDL